MTVLLFDGDVLLHVNSNIVIKPFYDKRKAEILERGGMPPDANLDEYIEISSDEIDNLVKRTAAAVKRAIKEICEVFFTEEFLFAVKSGNNFRDDIYWDYKGHRKSSGEFAIPWVGLVTEALQRDGFLDVASGMEADDLVRIWACQCKMHHIPYVVCTIDKDMDCIEGTHFNPKERKRYIVDELKAKQRFYSQLLQGDQVDKIPGLPGIGPKRADAAIAHCSTDEEFQEVVINMYIEKYGDAWSDYLLANGKLIHILRHHNDYFSFDEWPLAQEIR